MEARDEAFLGELGVGVARSRACLDSASTRAAAAFWSRSWLSSRTSSSVYRASAARGSASASGAWVSISGLLSSRITESGVTFVPGQQDEALDRASVTAGIQRMSSGTSVPSPRTSRTISPA